MHDKFDRLIRLLDDEAEIYKDLLDCVQKEKQAIVDLDFEKLGDIGRQKEDMLLKQRGLADKRDQVLNKLTDDLDLTTSEMTLNQLSAQAPLPYRKELRRCRRQLRDLLASLGTENAQVQHLVAHGLELVRGSYQLIAQLLDANPVYRSSGNMQPVASTGRFHQKDY